MDVRVRVRPKWLYTLLKSREDMRQKHLQAYSVMTKSYPDLAEKIFGKKIMGKNRNNRLGLK